MAFVGPRGGKRCRGAALLLSVSLLVPLLAATGVAQAQFRSLDRQSATSQTSADLQFTFVEGGEDGFTFLRTDFYVEASNGQVGLYAGLPLSRDLDESARDTVVGNFEVGFVGQVGVEDFEDVSVDEVEQLDLVYHIGVTFPTAHEDEEAALAAAPSVAGGASSGFASVLADAASLNLGLSPRVGRDFLFARLDAALDVAFFGNDEPDDGGFYKLGVGVGAEAGPAVFTVEYVRQNDLFGFDNLPPIEAVDTVTFGAGLELFDVESHAYLRIPVDGADEIQTFGLGVSYRF